MHFPGPTIISRREVAHMKGVIIPVGWQDGGAIGIAPAQGQAVKMPGAGHLLQRPAVPQPQLRVINSAMEELGMCRGNRRSLEIHKADRPVLLSGCLAA